jgi:hypothetical protein
MLRHKFAIILSVFLLASCASQQLRFLNEAGDAAATDNLHGLSTSALCDRFEESQKASPEFALAKTRVSKEFSRRGLTPMKCSAAYQMCLSYGVEENTPAFKQCLVETNNTLLLQSEIQRTYLLDESRWHSCHWRPGCL